MIDTHRSGNSEFNTKVIQEFRANEGHVGGALADTPILLLHHIGSKSKTERVTPVAYSRQDDGTFVIVASNGGSRSHPGWYHNLKANPRVEVELNTERFSARAFELAGNARVDLWPKLIEAAPSVGEFQAQTSRQIPIFVLTREDEGCQQRERRQWHPWATAWANVRSNSTL
jgi:deazaflavin-dependent oxidoreductase (nitroreductase family)